MWLSKITPRYLKKAFDTVNHELLINKLNSLGIKGNELNWFVSYLNNRVQAVNIGHSMSYFQGIKVGVPKGSILGPLLFIMLMIYHSMLIVKL